MAFRIGLIIFLFSISKPLFSQIAKLEKLQATIADTNNVNGNTIKAYFDLVRWYSQNKKDSLALDYSDKGKIFLKANSDLESDINDLDFEYR